MLGKKTIARMKIQKQNSNNLNKMVTLAIDRISSQRSGCFIPGVGVSFINYKNNTRDPIGHLLGYADLKGYWGLISSESQKPLVNKIRNKFGINISHASENDRLVNILQSLQDAHDSAFDEYNNHVSEDWKRMVNFLSDCAIIKMEFKL
jgi:hypothetical protein